MDTKKIFLSFAVIVGDVVLTMADSVISTLNTGNMAGNQFENSNASYLQFSSATAGLSLISIILLIAIWHRQIKQFWEAMVGLILIGLIFYPHPSLAYFSVNDKTEAYTILPNESAFWIPDVGANKDTQKRFESEDYLNETKIALKRFVVPHAKLNNSGGNWGWDSYVPTGRLIIVDRAPYAREWTSLEGKGTSNNKEGFPCQTKEGINLHAAISIGAEVTEQNAAKFLYHFGVNPPAGQRTDPEVIFTSVYYGRSLTQVMDNVVRMKVHTLVCNQFASRTFKEANDQALPIMNQIEKEVKDYFGPVGISLDFIGWADEFKFDDDIQKAINDEYVANRLKDVTQVLAVLTQLKVQEGLATGLSTKGLPMVVTPQMLETLAALANKIPGASTSITQDKANSLAPAPK